MKFIYVVVLFIFFSVYSTFSFAEIDDPKYFPPSGVGKYIKISYSSSAKKPDSELYLIQSKYKLSAINPSFVGTKSIDTQFVIYDYTDKNYKETMRMGIRPTNNADGEVGQAYFYYFGVEAGDDYTKNCHKGADDLPGVTCVVDLTTYDLNDYTLIVDIPSLDLQKGITTIAVKLEVIDPRGSTLPKTIEIGRFSVLRTSVLFRQPVTWVEGNSAPCSQVTTTAIEFYSLNVAAADGRYGYQGKYSLPIDTVVESACGLMVVPIPDGGLNMAYPREYLPVKQ